ncbi:MAG: hypothetical protein HYY02_13720 [Chloroflexi bacterium]|nr:hypothetical protein [Chloroflexota bacterium]
MAKRAHGKPKPAPRARQERPPQRRVPERPVPGPAPTSPRETTAPAWAASGRSAATRAPAADYTYVLQDLTRIGVLAGILLAGMIALSFVLR